MTVDELRVNIWLPCLSSTDTVQSMALPALSASWVAASGVRHSTCEQQGSEEVGGVQTDFFVGFLLRELLKNFNPRLF